MITFQQSILYPELLVPYKFEEVLSQSSKISQLNFQPWMHPQSILEASLKHP